MIDAVENAIYVVIDDEGSDKIMEVRRMLYNRQDRENIVWRCNPDEELYSVIKYLSKPWKYKICKCSAYLYRYKVQKVKKMEKRTEKKSV